MIERARALRHVTETTKKTKTTAAMPDEMAEVSEKHGLKRNPHGSCMIRFDYEWDDNIESLTNFQRTFESSTQTKMVCLQDCISQMNACLQGANAAVEQQSQVLTSILTSRQGASGRRRGRKKGPGRLRMHPRSPQRMPYNAVLRSNQPAAVAEA